LKKREIRNRLLLEPRKHCAKGWECSKGVKVERKKWRADHSPLTIENYVKGDAWGGEEPNWATYRGKEEGPGL